MTLLQLQERTYSKFGKIILSNLSTFLPPPSPVRYPPLLWYFHLTTDWNFLQNLTDIIWTGAAERIPKDCRRRLSIFTPLPTVLCGPGSSVGIATDYRLDRPGSNPGGDDIFQTIQTGSEAHPTSCKMGTMSFPGLKCGRGVLLTTHPLLVPRSWKSTAIPLGHTGPVTRKIYLYLTLSTVLLLSSPPWPTSTGPKCYILAIIWVFHTFITSNLRVRIMVNEWDADHDGSSVNASWFYSLRSCSYLRLDWGRYVCSVFLKTSFPLPVSDREVAISVQEH